MTSTHALELPAGAAHAVRLWQRNLPQLLERHAIPGDERRARPDGHDDRRAPVEQDVINHALRGPCARRPRSPGAASGRAR